MTSYLVILFLLLAISLGVLYLPKYEKTFSYSATVLLVFFAGTRLETGYDWQGYDSYFRSISGLKDTLCIGIPKLPLIVEPLFMLLNIGVKTFTAQVSVLYFLIAVFNLWSIHYVVSKISRSVPYAWMLYFGLAFLIAQMTTIRQGIASSLILLSLYLASQNKRARALLAIILAIGFHVSAIIFIPFLFLTKRFPHRKIILPVLFFGIICAISGVNIQNHIFTLAGKIPGLWMSVKFPSYQNTSHVISLASIGLVIYHCIILLLLETKATLQERKSPIICLAVWLTLLNLVAHLYFSGLPTIWNRVMFVALPWQIATVYSLEFTNNLNHRIRLFSLLGIFILSATSLVYSLKKADAAPFKPYYSVLEQTAPLRKADRVSDLMTEMILKNEHLNKGIIDKGPRRVLFEPLMKEAFDEYCKTE